MVGISVIIATYNRSGILRGALEALAAQEDPGVPVSVVVADNGSTDATHEVFERVSGCRPQFTWRYVYESRPGKSYAVNAALSIAQDAWLAFTDDDVRPYPDWLRAFAGAISRSDADFAVGRILPIWCAQPPSWLGRELYGVIAVPDNGDVPCSIALGQNEHIMPIGTNMAVRRSAIARIGGLRTDLGKLRGTLRTGEDHEFYLRLLHAGGKGVYVPDARVRHMVPAERLNRSYFRRWFYQNGRDVALLESAFPQRAATLLGVPRYKWRKAATDLLALVGAALSRRSAGLFRNEVSLLWFAGYLRERWLGVRS